MNKVDYEKACAMHRSGQSYRQIGDYFGVSRQCIHQTIKKGMEQEDLQQKGTRKLLVKAVLMAEGAFDEVAKEVGVSERTLWRWLSGGHIPLPKARQVAAIFFGAGSGT